MNLERVHRVYWGSHGCRYRKGHAHPCRCDCGEYYAGTHVYGEDMMSAVAKPERRDPVEVRV